MTIVVLENLENIVDRLGLDALLQGTSEVVGDRKGL